MKIKHVSKHTLVYIILFLLLITLILFIERVLMVKTQENTTTIEPKKRCAGCNGGPLKFIILLATFLYGTYYEDDLPHKNSGSITTIQATQLLSPLDIGSPQQAANNTIQKRKEDYQSHRRRMTMINDSFLK